MYVRLLVPCFHCQCTTCTPVDGTATCLPVDTTNKIGRIIWKEAAIKALHSVSG